MQKPKDPEVCLNTNKEFLSNCIKKTSKMIRLVLHDEVLMKRFLML